MIIDAQIHNPHTVGDVDQILGPELRTTVLTELALSAMAAVGVDAAVIHHPDRMTLKELQSISIPAIEAPRKFPSKFGGVVTPDPVRVKDIDELFALWRAEFGLLAARMTLAWPAPGPSQIERLENGGFNDWFRAAQLYDIPICIFVPGHLPALHKVAQEFPELRIIVDHLGLLPPPRVPVDPHTFEAIPDLISLAMYPNVAVKFTGVPALSRQGFPFQDLWPRVLPVVEAFGPGRLMWGSDYTRVSPLHNYQEAVDFIRCTSELSASEKEAIMSLSIREWLRWPIDEKWTQVKAGAPHQE